MKPHGPEVTPQLVLITSLEIIGEEHTLVGDMVGADRHLDSDGHEWAMNVVTRERFLDEQLDSLNHFRENLQLVDPAESTPEDAEEYARVPAFVVNDQRLTEESLKERFLNRVVTEGLLGSMWSLDDEQNAS